MINLEEIKAKFDGPLPENNEQWFELKAWVLELCDYAEKQRTEKETIHNYILTLVAQIYKNNYQSSKETTS